MKPEIKVNGDLRSLRNYGTLSFPYMQCVDEIKQYKNARVNWHWHDELEFIYVQSSSVICELDGMSLQICAGNGLFINSGVIHSFYTESDGVMSSFLFSPQLIAPSYTAVYEKFVLPVIGSNFRFMLLKKEVSWHKEILSILKRNIEYSDYLQQCYELDILLSIMSIWRIIYPNVIHTISDKPNNSIAQLQKRMYKMLEYIHQNYMNHITVDMIAAAAMISKSEAQRCFHKAVHTTPNNYLIEYRLSEAHRLLLSTSKAVSDIALEVGFESTSYFDRMYKKKYSISPKHTRAINP